MTPDAFEPWLQAWELTRDGAAIRSQSASDLLPVRRCGERAILKIAGHVEERRGGELMAWWRGVGAARVLMRQGDAILLERLDGVRSLAQMARSDQDDEATLILCRTAERLHAPRDAPLPSSLIPLDVWFRSLEDVAKRDSAFEEAAAAARKLLREGGSPVVLHGDLHHDNVLDGGDRGWLAIDPKGLIGERGFEFANLFRNPDLATALAPERLGRRATLVAKAAVLDRDRLLQWVLAYAGLGAAWTLESGGDPRPGLKIAGMASAEGRK